MTSPPPSVSRAELPIALIAARMGSRRLPGKVLSDICGRPLIDYVVSATSIARGLSGVMVVTSTESIDDPVAEWCRSQDVAWFRGGLENVSKRMLNAAQHVGASSFVRISGDSPLLDPQVVETAVAVFEKDTYDLVTNVHPRLLPPGQSVEVVKASSLEQLLREPDVTDQDLEHVTPVLYRREAGLRIRHLRWADFAPSCRGHPPFPSLTVDLPGDLRRVREVIKLLAGEAPWDAGWQRCASLMRQVDESLNSFASKTNARCSH